jgi:hypothetical protein
VLIESAHPVVELIGTAGVELQFHDAQPDWPFFFPHFVAIACEEAAWSEERKGLLFALVLVSSLAADSTSAVARLLRGSRRTTFRDLVAEWRGRIENLTPIAAPWVAAKLRGLKAELYV